ncbi:TetR family transcriptional regulator [Flavobacterium sp. W21_SRS_FM6]|uniref:TetR family transcriptional regulator n=1 Tax=Flavobacterium sp. W21_SRS_FM6 TaxID=3240268 RepID=UPI003F8F7ABD
MARKTKEDAIATRNILLDSAEQIFFDKGYSQTTLMDVATHAGMTRGAIYWHFKNKMELFEAMIERVHLPLESLVEACADENEPDPLGKFREFSIEFLQQIASDRRIQQVFSVMMHKFEYNGQVTQLEEKQLLSFQEVTSRIERTFNNAIKRGQLPVNLDIKKAAFAKHAFFSGIMNNWLFHPQTYDLAKNAESLVDSYFFMLSNSPHLRLADIN